MTQPDRLMIDELAFMRAAFEQGKLNSVEAHDLIRLYYLALKHPYKESEHG